MKIAVAQTRAVQGNITANIEAHKKLINLAISHKANAIFFPELSVTGYEPKLANVLATNEDDRKFDVFQRISNENKITIGIGAPTKANSGIRISMIIFQPDTSRQTYSKQLLHADEVRYFTKGEKQIILTVSNERIAPAICYESLQTVHSAKVSELGSDIYVACVAKSQNGIEKAMSHFPLVARKFLMPVLMSNCVGYCDNFESVGKSAVWTKEGNLAGQLDDRSEGLLIFDTHTEELIKSTIER